MADDWKPVAAAQPAGGDWRPVTQATAQPSTPATDGFLANNPVGRVLDAFGQGAKAGWGAGPIGVSPETEKELSKAGIFMEDRDFEPGSQYSIGRSFRAFNESFMRPAAAALDATLRAGSAAFTGTANAAVQAASEIETATGTDRGQGVKDPKAITSDTLLLADTLGIVPGSSMTPHYLRGTPAEVPVREAAEPPKPIETPEAVSGVAASTAETPRVATVPLPKSDTSMVDKAGNIRLDNLNKPEDVKQVFRETAQANDDFSTARGGEIPLAQREAAAQALGLTPENFKPKNPTNASWSTWTEAVKTVAIQSAEAVRDSMAKAANGSDEDVLAYAEAKARHQMIQEEYARVTAEGGRTLNALKKDQATSIADTSLNDFLLKSTGKSVDDLRAEAKAGAELETPQQVSKFLNDARKPTFKDRFIEYYANALLSGPATHTTYAASNLIHAIVTVPEAALAGGIGKLRTMLPGADADRVYVGEAGARLYGLAQGSREGVMAAWRALKSGVSEKLPGEPEASAAPGTGKIQKAIPGVAGEIVRVPSRVIAGIHSFFRAVGYRQELNARAYRAAAKEMNDPLAVGGDTFAQRMAQIASDPDEDMMAASVKNANIQAFMEKPKWGSFGQKLEAISNHNAFTKVALMFVRVATNIVKEGLQQRTPLGLMTQEVRDNLAGKNGGAAQDTQMARLTLGTSIGIGVASLAAEGLITGSGPSDPREMAVWRLTGRQPYSVNIGGTWYEYHRMGAFGLLAGVSADMHDIVHAMSDEDGANVASLVTHSISNNLIHESWLRGLSDALEAVKDPDRKGAQWVRNQAASMLPFSTGLGQVTHAIDPELRDARTILDTVKSKIPFMSQTVLPRRDIWGEPITRDGSLGPDALSAIYESKANNDPVNLELQRLGIFPAKLEQKIRGVTLTPEQYDDYQRIAGRLAKWNLDRLVNTPRWPALLDFAKKETIERIIKKNHETAATYLLMSDPTLLKASMDNRVKQISGK